MTGRYYLAPSADPVRLDEVVLGDTTPFVMAPGVPLRAAPCLVCRRPAGGQLVSILFVAGFDEPACECGSIGPAAFIRHVSCPEYPDQVIADMAIATILHHHPRQGNCA